MASPGGGLGRPLDGVGEQFAVALRHHQAGQLVEAERQYRTILALEPNHSDSLHLLGLVAHQVGRNDLAVELIGKAIALNKRNPAFQNNIGLAFDALGRYEEAVAHYKRAVALKPDYAQAHNNLGAALLAQAKPDESVVHYRRAVALKPDFAEAHSNLGNALKAMGRLDDAVAQYQQALALTPDLAEAHNNLGNALKEQGRLDEAMVRYQQALALNPNYAEAHYNLGNALRQQGKLDEAADKYQQALALKPDYAEAHNNLGSLLQEQGKSDAAMVSLQRALAARPSFAEARNNLGNALEQQGRLDDAATQYQHALALKPDSAEAYNNLGAVFMQQGRLNEALALFDRAVTFDPANARAFANLGKALMTGGAFPLALDAIQRSLELAETENTRLLFLQCVMDLGAGPDGVELRRNLIRALTEPWGRPIYLARFCARLLKTNKAIRACVDRVSEAWPRRLAAAELFRADEFAEICNDELLRSFLTATLTADLELERLLTAARTALLEHADAAGEACAVESAAVAFYSALAQQCFLSEYVFGLGEGEGEQADRLRARLTVALSSGAAVPEIWLVAVAAYHPLSDLSVAEAIASRHWSPPVAALVRSLVLERQRELELRPSVPHLTPITEGVSELVKQQYEDNPYPRWTQASPVAEYDTIEAYLRRRFPLTPLRSASGGTTFDILIAGCGTGQHSIETARGFPSARVLAVDLSLTSLCYAKRKTLELGLTNIEYAQADLLHMPALGRGFDLIEASGSLQCMADQLEGWRLLLSMVRPGGYMLLGLYSQTARADINDARRMIAEGGYRPRVEDIRRFRQELAGFAKKASIRPATESPDFFSTSACRDLLFHVQEHQSTLPEIKAFILENRLEFLGFELPGHFTQQFRTRFAPDSALLDLDLWHLFEIENPLLFGSMYEFWVQTPP
jgi:tetratricopeptide (TPR) repeat protein/SAM-dependent methyltransferase